MSTWIRWRVQHSATLLADNPLADVIQADLRRPADVLASRTVNDLLDFTAPVAVLMIAVLHFVSDADDPAGIVAQFTDALVAGGFVATSMALARLLSRSTAWPPAPPTTKPRRSPHCRCLRRRPDRAQPQESSYARTARHWVTVPARQVFDFECGTTPQLLAAALVRTAVPRAPLYGRALRAVRRGSRPQHRRGRDVNRSPGRLPARRSAGR
ncbi:SAM-dependent methyltransferase [Micromonospora sp. NPDC023814]|uniref:SAM-dependent methyltransferase n=1 Tax=Micromonospora sp. NPDC023814 TaxID=3154596 RepID=UPI0033DFA646